MTIMMMVIRTGSYNYTTMLMMMMMVAGMVSHVCVVLIATDIFVNVIRPGYAK
jgi:hypothetical protein